jgi:acyl-lipid omega-6 desaturase (Delta-12 desaturase)
MKNQKGKLLKKQVSPYEKANTLHSVRQILNTIVPYIIVWVLAYQSLSVSYLLTLGFAVIGAGLTTRIFIIFHDCCHYSFFKSRKANQIVGTITGIMTFFPFYQWQHNHSVHHASSGNLDKRGVGDIWVLTVEEYASASLSTRIKYRLYRSPLVMFGLGPIYEFLIRNRFNRKGARLKERLNVYLTNVSIVGIIALLGYFIGWESFLLVQFPMFYIAGVMGVWLFYVQHNFENSYFEENKDWEYVQAAVEGSSFYKLPKVLQWFTGNIGFHHVHHLAPRVPNYMLESAHEGTDPLKHVPTITLATSLSSLKFRLWDEDAKKFVGFKAAKSFSEMKLKNVSVQTKRMQPKS